MGGRRYYAALESRRCLHLLGDWIQEASVKRGIERHPQLAVIIVAEGNEAERLHARALILARGLATFRPCRESRPSGCGRRSRRIPSGEFLLQLEQSAGDGNGLKFCARPLSAFSHYRSRDRSVELYTRRTPLRVGLGEVAHTSRTMPRCAC